MTPMLLQQLNCYNNFAAEVATVWAAVFAAVFAAITTPVTAAGFV